MILCALENKPHPNKTDISSDWQKANIFGVSLKSSVQPQCVASLDPWYKSKCHLNIQ